jgi:putative transposase
VAVGASVPVNAPHLVALVRTGARFERGVLVEREEFTAA